MVDFFVCKKQRTRGTLGYIRNCKTEEKNRPNPQNRQKNRSKPKTSRILKIGKPKNNIG